MQLDRLAEEIFHDRRHARRGLVAPPHKLALHKRLAFLGLALGFGLGCRWRRLCRRRLLRLELCLPLLFGTLLGNSRMAGVLAGSHEIVILIACADPDDQGGNHHSKQQELGAEEAAAVDHEAREEDLQPVVEGYAGSDHKQHYRRRQ